MTRVVLLSQDEDGIWIAEVPSLPGCNSQGDTRDEAIANIQNAIAGYIEVLQDAGQPVPGETHEVVTLIA